MTAMRARMRKEIEMLETDPPHGVSAWPKDDKIDQLEAQILGPDGSPYEKGVFHLEIEIPERYPFEPPKVRFTTPIYHPNIDDAGRICLDTLKMQPKGSWLPSVNISTLLTTIRLLMAEPNAEDGLMPEITDLFKHNRELFNKKAAELTLKHARSCEIRQSVPMTKEVNDTADVSVNVKETKIEPKQEQVGSLSDADDSFSDGSSFSEDEQSGSDDDEIAAESNENDVDRQTKRRRHN